MEPTALLVMDLQAGIVDRLGGRAGPLLSTVSAAVAAARAGGVTVVHVRVAFRPGAPEISRHNRSFAALSTSGAMDLDAPATQIHAAVAPAPGEVVITKKRVSAFTGSDLEVVLRGLEIRSLVLAGVATSGVVLSTLRQAADLDFDLTVLEDGCADGDEEVHRVLCTKVFPRQAVVLRADDWTSGLPTGS